jgi:hypothetical protein
MPTKGSKASKSDAVKFLEQAAGGALTLGRLLYSIRRSDDISQVEFAKTLGISKSHRCDLEKERRLVSPARAWAWGKSWVIRRSDSLNWRFRRGYKKTD